MLRVSSTFAVLTLLLVACDAPAPTPTAEAPATAATQTAATEKPADTKPAAAVPNSYGDPITATTETSLATIVSEPGKYANQEVKTAGVVKAVCQKAGCWMEIGDETSQAHIKMAGHKFFVPRTVSGKKAVIQGTVKEGAPQNECGSKDACGGEDNGAVAKVEIVATGVQFVD